MNDRHVEEREEAERWQGLVSTFRVYVPDLDAWLAEDEAPVVSPGTVWNTLTLRLFERDRTPNAELLDVWVTVLALLEVVEEALDLVSAHDPSADDATLLYSFADAGILCEIGWNQAGAAALLPYMGSRTARALRADLAYHDRIQREWGGHDLDWRIAGTLFRPLRLQPADLLPADFTDQ